MLCRRWLGALVVAAVMVPLAAVVLADDFEDPVQPPPIGGYSCPVGETEVEAGDLWGPGIDVKEALEPQMTVLLMLEEQSLSPGMITVVQTSPTFENWVAER